MKHSISNALKALLACPHCGTSLPFTETGAHCPSCELQFGFAPSGALDLRPQCRKVHRHDFTLDPVVLSEPGLAFGFLEKNHAPAVDFTGLTCPPRLTRKILSHFPSAPSNTSLVLDLGCGDLPHRGVCERAGYEYVGLDYSSPKATVLGDAHSIPFHDNTFDFVLSIAVLEHLRFPVVAASEVYRVLKSEGVFLGSVAFLEPFHANSFYHHTHLGTYYTLMEGGFKHAKISPYSRAYSGLTALSTMGLFPKMPRLLSTALAAPLQLLHRIWWRAGHAVTKHPLATEDHRIFMTTAAFAFLARK